MIGTAHRFFVKLEFDTHVKVLFTDTEAQADHILQAIHEAIAKGRSVISSGDAVISLHGFRAAYKYEKPADVPDSEWLG